MQTQRVEEILNKIDEIQDVLETDSLEDEDENIHDNVDVAVDLMPLTSSSSSTISEVDTRSAEIESIQKDLETLMTQINSFVAIHKEEQEAKKLPKEDSDSEKEKDDGPSEKELSLCKSLCTDYDIEEYIPCEVDWNAVGPVIQNTVGQLQMINNLRSNISAMINRIHTVTAEAGIEHLSDSSDQLE